MQPGSIPGERQQSILEYANMAKIGPQEAVQIASDETNGSKVLKFSLERRGGFLVCDIKTATPYKSIRHYRE